MQWPKRFSSKIEIRGPDECWLWKAVLIPAGYGQFWFDGKMHNAHRMALKLSGIDIPEGCVVLHTCDTRRCCNPRHLVIGTQADNIRDMIRKGRSAKGSKHGMAILSEDNVIEIFARNETAAEAAARYGVSRATINDIRSGRNWSHITTPTL